MTPKEKADDLIKKYQAINFDEPILNLTTSEAKECALIAVDEIIKACPIELVGNAGKFKYTEDYWKEVKAELEKP